MPEPRIAKSLGRLREQVHALFPNGPPLSEYGWIASPEHRRRSPNSDHNEDARGIVRALDIPHAPEIGLDTYELANHLRDEIIAGREKRVRYIISNRRIFNLAISKAWRPYSGDNAHDQHVHISVVKGPPENDPADDPHDWSLGDISAAPDQVASSRRPLLKRGMTGDQVRLVQLAIMVDGIFGPLTEEAVRRWQALEGLDDDGDVGPLTWRALEYRYPDIFKEAPPTPAPIEPPIHPPTEGWQTNITATVFGGSAERQTSGYDEHVIDDDEFGVALPFRFPADRRSIVQIHNLENNKAVNANIVDIGPWMIDDNYWTHNARPIAETHYIDKEPLPNGPNRGKVPSNPAGIDLTPATARALGIEGKGKVNWRFVT